MNKKIYSIEIIVKGQRGEFNKINIEAMYS